MAFMWPPPQHVPNNFRDVMGVDVETLKKSDPYNDNKIEHKWEG